MENPPAFEEKQEQYWYCCVLEMVPLCAKSIVLFGQIWTIMQSTVSNEAL